MNDICLCGGQYCPLKDMCIRYLSHKWIMDSGAPNYETYFEEPPFTFTKNSCDYFIKAEDDEQNSYYFSQL